MTTSSTAWPCAAVPHAELAGRTTMRVGGQAEWLLEPADPTELRAAWHAAKDRGMPVRILGGGANLIIEDGLHAGVTIATERMRRVFRPLDEADGAPLETDAALTEPRALVAHDRTRDPRLVAWCGASLPGLSRAASQLGWSGLEGLAGVPGSVGGGLAMNAGGRWGEMWDHVTEAMLLDEEGELSFVTKEAVQPEYRNGRLGSRVAVGCVFKLDVEHPQVVKDRARDFLLEKNAVQPVSQRSAGCAFKNPDPELSDGRSAGQLVDQAGGKGRERGDAIVSPLHGNFIVNRGKATSADVLTLIDDIHDLVLEKMGVDLQIEVKRWLRPTES